MTASTSLEGLRSVTKKLIIPSDLMSKLQPRKKIPKTTVRESTHITAIWTILMMKRLLSSGALAVKPLSVTTDERLQHKRISSVRLEKIPLSVWLNVVFMSTFKKTNFKNTWKKSSEYFAPGSQKTCRIVGKCLLTQAHPFSTSSLAYWRPMAQSCTDSHVTTFGASAQHHTCSGKTTERNDGRRQLRYTSVQFGATYSTDVTS